MCIIAVCIIIGVCMCDGVSTCIYTRYSHEGVLTRGGHVRVAHMGYSHEGGAHMRVCTHEGALHDEG